MIELFYVSIGCIISTLLFHFPKLISKKESNANDFEIIFGKNYKTLFEGEQDQVHLAFVMLWESYREEFLEALAELTNSIYKKRDFTKWLREYYNFKPEEKFFDVVVNGVVTKYSNTSYIENQGILYMKDRLIYVSKLPEEKMKERLAFQEDLVRTRLIGDKILGVNDLNSVLSIMVRNRNKKRII